MINFRIIARVISQMLIIEGLFMVLPALVSLIYGEKVLSSFIYSSIITLVTGILAFTPLRKEEKVYSTREGYILVGGIWIIFSLFGTLPFIFSGVAGNFTDAFFETVSGFTTTAASVFTDIESLPRGIVFWRCLMSWIGGITIIVIALSVFPVFKAMNIQLSVTEFSGQMTEKLHPKTTDTARRFIALYITLTLIEAIMLKAGGMSFFDSVCHSLSTISTGGFSSRNDNMSAFSSPYIQSVIIIFMFLSGTNLSFIYFAVKRNFKKITGDTEFRLYFGALVFFSLIAGLILVINKTMPAGNAFMAGFFNTVSVITTTGFYTHDYSTWGGLLILLIFLLMFPGGMAGSATGGIKMIRMITIFINSRKEVRRLIHPEAYLPVFIDRKIIEQSVVYNVLVFVTLYFLIMCTGAFLISLMGYDIITSFSTSASMLGNIGPGIGTFGPFSNYASLPLPGKWIMSALMLIGRVEILALLVLFTRTFYKR
ncbi:MAG: TrkH family potassium uptake protein [Bacteroidales bacterium]|nr:TrkH family potassium uptake protein [Bacteroidales bacterium]